MWDYDKLFAEGNIVGFKHSNEEQIHPYIIYEKNDCMDYFNDSLYYKSKDFISEIQYIIRLDERGNVAEILFDRKRDMPKPMPELETGMFVYVPHIGTGLGFVDAENNHIIYQKGGFDYIQDNKLGKGIITEITKVYSKNIVYSFNLCDECKPIWEKFN